MRVNEASYRRFAAVAMMVGACVAALAQLSVPAPRELTAIQRFTIEADFARADTNGDGRLSRAEAMRLPEIAAQFDALDTNQDEFLSFEEFAAGATPPAK